MKSFASSFAVFATITSAGLAAADHVPMEQFSFNYEEIHVDYAKQSVDAYFDSDDCTLWVDGDEAANVVLLTRDAWGELLINGGEVAIDGDVPTGENTCRISVYGGGGNDLLIDATGMGAELAGGSGSDVLLWDYTAGLGLRNTLAARSDGLDVDVVLVAGTTSPADDDVWVEGTIITAPAVVADDVWIEGKIITAPAVVADDVWVDGKIITAPAAVADDVWIDGKIITADNYDASNYFDGKFLTAGDLNRDPTFEITLDDAHVSLGYDAGYTTVSLAGDGHKREIEILSWSWGETKGGSEQIGG